MRTTVQKHDADLGAGQGPGVGNLRPVGEVAAEGQKADGTGQRDGEEQESHRRRRYVIEDDPIDLALPLVCRCNVDGLVEAPGKEGDGDGHIKADCEFLHGDS